MASGLQAALANASCLYNTSISRSPCPLKITGNRTSFSSSLSTKSLTWLRALAQPNSNTSQEIVRPLGNFSPDIWGDRFLSLPFTDSEFESCSRQVEILKGTAKDILMASMDDPIENILVMNSFCRLGISYHFEREIEEQLSHLFTILPRLIENKDYKLHKVATIFQVFRSYGFKMSCDVFNKFKNIGDGMFKEEVGKDIKGMISLYEASHWRMKGELILDEAFSFTKLQLESIANQTSRSYLQDHIVNTLQLPYQRNMPRLAARQYISFYENDESRNDVLLKFAKYDFNRVQMLLQQELNILSSWWRSNIASRFPYIRQRIVEIFSTMVLTYFEPHFARSREILTKWMVVFLLLDDTYDAYGTYEELQHLSKAIKRLDISAIDELPIEYLKTLCETILNICNEHLEELIKEGRTFSVSYSKEEVKKLVQTYDVQARWTHKCLELPTYEEYFDNGKQSIGLIVSMAAAMIGMEEADENAYQWLNNPHSKILEAGSVIWRLTDDIWTNEAEEKRGGQVSGTACYMKQYGVSRKEAIEVFKERIEDAWKEVNEGFMRPFPVPTQIMMRALNLIRLVEVSYMHGDGYTNPATHKDNVAKVLVDPIPIQD